MSTRYTYRDFATGKVRSTSGAFAGWQRGGPLMAWYALFQRQRSTLCVPAYCLTRETREKLPPQPAPL